MGTEGREGSMAESEGIEGIMMTWHIRCYRLFKGLLGAVIA